MGLGIYIGAKAEPARLQATEGAEPELLQAIRSAIPLAIGDLLHTTLSEVSKVEDGLNVYLHPAEEPLEFRLDQGELLTASAKTSSAGPGYHAFLVHFLEDVASQSGLNWDWDNDEAEFSDESGYFGDRDFRRLQLEMLKWLRSIARHITEEDGYSHLSISLPAGFQVLGDYFAISSMGYWDRKWFESVAEAPEEALYERGAEFFPWWNQDRDAQFWLNCGLAKAWVELHWHPPKDEYELSDCRNTLKCFETARRLDPSVPVPDREVEELQRLTEQSDLSDFRPADQGVGFRRRPMRRGLTGGWTIVLPGFYYGDTENDGTTVVYWYGNRTVRGTSLSFKEGAPRQPAGSQAQESQREFDFHQGHLTGEADIEWVETEDEAYWQLQGEMRTDGEICIVTVCFENAADREWAVETWKSAFLASEE